MTTSYHADERLRAEARELAARLQTRYIARGRSTLSRLRREFGAEAFLIIGETGLRYAPVGADELFFHPSTSFLRLKRLLGGERDVLLSLAGVEAGDRVLDCTAGLASDAIVFAHAVGDQGEVVALESEPMLALLVSEGLRTYESGLPEADAAMRRIVMHTVDHEKFLSQQPDCSFDIVFFDPMFRMPIGGSPSISPLRGLANPAALTERAVAEAKRVARKRVVLKENRDSREFARLGFSKIGRSHTKVAYGVMER